MKKIYSTAILLVYSISLLAQSGYVDEEDIDDFERYAHFGLSEGEIISVIIGIIILLIAKNMTGKNENIRMGLGCFGVILAFPLALVIIAVAQKAIGYAVILAIVVGGLYLIFGQRE